MKKLLLIGLFALCQVITAAPARADPCGGCLFRAPAPTLSLGLPSPLR
jgi:hypothetical protein